MLSALKVVKIRSTEANKVFDSITHPTDAGASRLTFQSKKTVPAELCLLVAILCEEYRADTSVPSVGLDGWTEEPPTLIRQRIPSFIEGEQIPGPPLEFICEFDLCIAEFNRPTGRVVAAVFSGLTITSSRRKVRYVDQKEHARIEFDGKEAATSGIWRSPFGNQGIGCGPANDRKAG